MKNIIKSIILISGLFLISCDKGFEELNTNKTAATAINPVFTFNNSIVNMSFPANTLMYEVGIVQQMVTPNSGVLTGANFNQENGDNTQAIWQRMYRNVIRNSYDVINTTKALPNRSNLYNMARIWQSYAFMLLTDTYGEVPYSEAGKGYTDQITFPGYETQQAIYTGIIKEITEAAAALDATKGREAAEVLYGGDIVKWKKFAYSLLLRAGMRLSEVDQALAKSTVEKAIAGGLMTANTDNCFIKHDANYTNGIGSLLNSTEAANFYIAKPFVDHLKSTNDPRLKSIAVRYVGATSGPQQVAARATTDPNVQIGMPFGFDNSTIIGQSKTDGLAGFYDYSQVDRSRMVKPTAPMFLLTFAQTQLLLAEAAQRGWATGSAADYYKAGIGAHLAQMADYDAGSAVSASDADAYLAANTLDASKALEQINTQYWIASFLNGPEAFANFRRSGFPKLTPNPFPGKAIQGDFINRLTYPTSEISVNKTNLDASVARQGANTLDTKVWWDK
jgi:Starch-binding associating with outer membrane